MVEDVIVFIEEEKYQKIKKQLNKEDDYFSKEELQKINVC